VILQSRSKHIYIYHRGSSLQYKVSIHHTIPPKRLDVKSLFFLPSIQENFSPSQPPSQLKKDFVPYALNLLVSWLTTLHSGGWVGLDDGGVWGGEEKEEEEEEEEKGKGKKRERQTGGCACVRGLDSDTYLACYLYSDDVVSLSKPRIPTPTRSNTTYQQTSHIKFTV